MHRSQSYNYGISTTPKRSFTWHAYSMFKPRLHNVVKPVWQPVKCLYTRYNRLSIRLSNRFDNRLYRVQKHSTGCQTRLTTGLTTCCIVYTAGCQTGCTIRFDNRLNEQRLFVQTGWTNSGCSFNTVFKPVWQPVVSCKRGIMNLWRVHRWNTFFFLPPPRTGKEDMWLSLSVCLLATLRKNFRTDLHDIFREGWQWVSEENIKFWYRSASPSG